MHKDLRTGMVVGLILAAVAAVWLSTHPDLTTKARIQRRAQAPLRSGNTELLQGIIAQPLTPPAAEPPDGRQQAKISKSPETGFHIVRSGETLSDISYKYYGSANKWRKIHNANRQTIKDANILVPGTKLVIPD